MRYQQLLEDAKTLYHGDDFGTTRLEPRWMIHDVSNNLEGVGIYFSPDINVAKSYGSKIISINASGLSIANSRQSVDSIVPDKKAIDFLQHLNRTNEDFWYLITDYGIEVSDQSDVEMYHLQALHDMMKPEEMRNWQIELAQVTDIETFVPGWNKYIGIDGMYNPENSIYTISNPAIPVTPLNF